VLSIEKIQYNFSCDCFISAKNDKDYPNKGDRGVAQEYDFVQFGILNNFQPIYFEVYDVNTHYYFQYDGLKIYNDLTYSQYVGLYN